MHRGLPRRVGAWLAVLALAIQSALPLADAALHEAFSIPSDADVTVAAPLDTSAVETVSKQAPAHHVHACPICAFITTVGSFTPPVPTQAVTPVSAPHFAIWPTAPPAPVATAASAAQPRAPPALI